MINNFGLLKVDNFKCFEIYLTNNVAYTKIKWSYKV